MSRATYRKHVPTTILVNRPEPERTPAPILLSARQAALALNLAYDTVTLHMRQGKIPTVMIGKRRWVVVSGADAWYRQTGQTA